MIKRNRLLKKSLVIVTSLALGFTLTDFNPLVQETARILAADTLLNSGDCSADALTDSVQWQVYDTDGDGVGDKLVISGTGKMKNFASSGEPWFSYKSNLKTVIVGEGVTTIGNYAFYNGTRITSVSLPSGLSSIGDSAFYYCENLTLAELPSGLTSIGAAAFRNCKNITLTELPSGITSIGSSIIHFK